MFFQGGYNIEAISNSAVAVARVLLGEAPGELGPMVATEEGTETVWAVAMEQSKYWKGLDPKACDPMEGETFRTNLIDYVSNTLFLALAFGAGGIEHGNICTSIPEILKLYRQVYMAERHGMMEIPLYGTELVSRFKSQIMCT